MTDNCSWRGTVDFGDGPVRVRCTQTGEHSVHLSQVLIEQGITTRSFPLVDMIPPRGAKWEHDFHYYIEFARVCSSMGNFEAAAANAAIAQAFATAKISMSSK